MVNTCKVSPPPKVNTRCRRWPHINPAHDPSSGQSGIVLTTTPDKPPAHRSAAALLFHPNLLAPLSLFHSFSSSFVHSDPDTTSPPEQSPASSSIRNKSRRRTPILLSFSPCRLLSRKRSQRILLCLPFEHFGRSLRRVLSRPKRSSTWILKPVFRSLSASSRQRTGSQRPNKPPPNPLTKS